MPNCKKLSLMLLDIMSIYLSIVGAFLIRFDGKLPVEYLRGRMDSFILITLTYLGIFTYFRFHKRAWRYASIDEAMLIVKASTLGIAAMIAIQLLMDGTMFPRSVLLLTWLLSIFIIGGMRFSLKIHRQIARVRVGMKQGVNRGLRPTLIIGAGDAGEMILTSIQRNPGIGYGPVGFLDDDPEKQGMYIHGVKVLGTIAKLSQLLEELEIKEVIIAMPSVGGVLIRDILDRCKRKGIRVKTVPSVAEIIRGVVDVRDVRDIRVEDLLRREATPIDLEEISDYLFGQKILVTGAGGSIGSELCRQIAAFEPEELVFLDYNENSLFEIETELRRTFPSTSLKSIIADIKDEKRMVQVFDQQRPNIVFHAAAHKHVPLMELNPQEAIKNNVIGTRILAEASEEFRIDRFILVSTDKAANPKGVMGASKRVAEYVVQMMNQNGNTKFIIVRFGNVLASQGSVIPLMRKQIERGGPITITHPEMRRYFMTIPEAVQLIVQAGAIGNGGEIFVLDMGAPIKIVDLANDLIRLAGLEPGKDIKVEFTGIRPGEKLCEDLVDAYEELSVSSHEKIFVVESQNRLEKDKFYEGLKQLGDFAIAGKILEMKRVMSEMISTYQPEDLS